MDFGIVERSIAGIGRNFLDLISEMAPDSRIDRIIMLSVLSVPGSTSTRSLRITNSIKAFSLNAKVLQFEALEDEAFVLSDVSSVLVESAARHPYGQWYMANINVSFTDLLYAIISSAQNRDKPERNPDFICHFCEVAGRYWGYNDPAFQVFVVR